MKSFKFSISLFLILLVCNIKCVYSQITAGSKEIILNTANPNTNGYKTEDEMAYMNFSKLFNGFDKEEKRHGGIVADNFGISRKSYVNR